jgi:hypothetical protein
MSHARVAASANSKSAADPREAPTGDFHRHGSNAAALLRGSGAGCSKTHFVQMLKTTPARPGLHYQDSQPMLTDRGTVIC